jgi:hypothetical protein
MTYKKLEETCARLETIASGFPARSREARAIKIAAHALIYVHTEKMKDKFTKFMLAKNRVLTQAQIFHLRAIGIDPSNEPDRNDERRKARPKS